MSKGLFAPQYFVFERTYWMRVQHNLKPYGYHGPTDGVPGSKTYEALEEFARRMNFFGESITSLADRVSNLAEELYWYEVGAEDDGRDHSFPDTSPDPSMTPEEYYWYTMRNHATPKAERILLF